MVTVDLTFLCLHETLCHRSSWLVVSRVHASRSISLRLFAFEMLIHRVHDVTLSQKPWLVSTVLNDLGNFVCGRRELGVLPPTPRARSHRLNAELLPGRMTNSHSKLDSQEHTTSRRPERAIRFFISVLSPLCTNVLIAILVFVFRFSLFTFATFSTFGMFGMFKIYGTFKLLFAKTIRPGLLSAPRRTSLAIVSTDPMTI